MDDDETKARNRLLMYGAARVSGLAIFFMGVAIMFTAWLRPGGWPQVGAIIAIMGMIDALFAPRLMKRAWDEQDSRGQ